MSNPMVPRDNCVLCVVIQGIPTHATVRRALETKELTIETVLELMRDSIVTGWTLRDMARDPSEAVCEGHAEMIAGVKNGETETEP
jgi:hypothetical protein